MSFRTLKVQKNPECPVCGEHPTVTELIDYQQFCGLPSLNDHAERPREFANGVPA
jgi:adenylyltransferase/sulfurtransferase